MFDDDEEEIPEFIPYWYVCVRLPDIGIVYVRYKSDRYGSWYTKTFTEKKLWKTRKGAVNWILARPELLKYCSIHTI